MISPQQVQSVAAEVEQRGLGDATVNYLRQHYPAWHFTHCLDDDIHQAPPVLECAGFNVYLVGGGHCLSLTGDYAAATGLVLAACADE